MTTHPAVVETIPSFSGSATLDEFRSAYDSVQCVFFQRKPVPTTRKRKRRRKRKQECTTTNFLATIQSAFDSASPKDQESWCVENGSGDSDSTSPLEFLSTKSHRHGYCSFILQDDAAVSNFTKRVAPHDVLPIDGLEDGSITTAAPYWLFVGRNTHSDCAMKGRSEHTDDVRHDGSFHYQCTGSKTWCLRPTQELRERTTKLKDRYKITCREGDVLVLNTRLWWHQTELPPKASCASTRPHVSISFARDIYLNGKQPPAAETMSNQEGAWAVGFLPKGTLLWTPDPDPPMQKTTCQKKANCKLEKQEDEEEEERQWAVVTLRDIQESEFFVLLEEGNEKG